MYKYLVEFNMNGIDVQAMNYCPQKKEIFKTIVSW